MNTTFSFFKKFSHHIVTTVMAVGILGTIFFAGQLYAQGQNPVDFSIDPDITMSPSIPGYGSPVTFTVRTGKTGSVNAGEGANVPVSFYLDLGNDGVFESNTPNFTDSNISSNASNGTAQWVTSIGSGNNWTVFGGMHTIFVCVNATGDPDNPDFGFSERSTYLGNNCTSETFGLLPPPVLPGCTNSNATNYNQQANEDDGTCTFLCEDPADVNFRSTSPCANIGNSFAGCLDPNAENYNPTARIAANCIYMCDTPGNVNYHKKGLACDDDLVLGQCVPPRVSLYANLSCAPKDTAFNLQWSGSGIANSNTCTIRKTGGGSVTKSFGSGQVGVSPIDQSAQYEISCPGNTPYDEVFAISTFIMQVCPVAPTYDCGNNGRGDDIDNDGDGLIDEDCPNLIPEYKEI